MWLCCHSNSTEIVEVAQLLIANGVDVNQRNEYVINGLIFLCYESNNDKIVKVAQLLITNGIDVKQTNTDEKTAAMLLNKNKNNFAAIMQLRSLLGDETIPSTSRRECVVML